jgi:hypothetical protein
LSSSACEQAARPSIAASGRAIRAVRFIIAGLLPDTGPDLGLTRRA